jgi:hypothetical protein
VRDCPSGNLSGLKLKRSTHGRLISSRQLSEPRKLAILPAADEEGKPDSYEQLRPMTD